MISAPTKRGIRSLALAASAAAVGALTACSDLHLEHFGHHRLSSEEALVATTPALGHPIAFVERNEYLDVELPPSSRGLSRNQWVDVYRFGLRFRNEATGTLVLSPPATRHGGGRWHPAVADARRALHSAGVAPEQIAAGPAAKGPVLTIAFHKPVAVAPNCGHWHRDVGREPERLPMPNFGCATQRNLAGMIANSRDLIVAEPETPASSERRQRVWSKYTGADQAGGQSAGSETATDAKPKGTKK
jgi:pilus assembly protein CpaD